MTVWHWFRRGASIEARASQQVFWTRRWFARPGQSIFSRVQPLKRRFPTKSRSSVVWKTNAKFFREAPLATARASCHSSRVLTWHSRASAESGVMRSSKIAHNFSLPRQTSLTPQSWARTCHSLLRLQRLGFWEVAGVGTEGFFEFVLSGLDLAAFCCLGFGLLGPLSNPRFATSINVWRQSINPLGCFLARLVRVSKAWTRP